MSDLNEIDPQDDWKHKPATGELGMKDGKPYPPPMPIMCEDRPPDQSPTTGEWTAADVLQMGCDRADPAYAISDAHNSALAALQDENKTFRAAQKACEDCDGPTMAEVQQLRDQLADEREALATVRELREHDQKALAAERETAQKLIDQTTSYREALMAEREKVQSLVRELRHCANRIAGGYRSQSTMLTDDQLVTRADTVLAKVGKQ